MVCHDCYYSTTAILIMPEIGAWGHVDVERTAPIEDMQVLLCLFLSLTAYNVSGLGWHL
jgi:hypothetical protein